MSAARIVALLLTVWASSMSVGTAGSSDAYDGHAVVASEAQFEYDVPSASTTLPANPRTDAIGARSVPWVSAGDVRVVLDGVSAAKRGADEIPDDALVARGGANITPESVARGTGRHPSGVEGFSVESRGGCSLIDLCQNIPHGQVGVTTAGDVRRAGGNVVRTSGRSANHATVSGLSPEVASGLLSPSVPNPVRRGR